MFAYNLSNIVKLAVCHQHIFGNIQEIVVGRGGGLSNISILGESLIFPRFSPPHPRGKGERKKRGERNIIGQVFAAGNIFPPSFSINQKSLKHKSRKRVFKEKNIVFQQGPSDRSGRNQGLETVLLVLGFHKKKKYSIRHIISKID